MHEVYANIKRLRMEKNMSQSELAKLTGYTDRSSIAKIEKGLVDLQIEKINQFANALGVESSELMGWETDSPEDIGNALADIYKDVVLLEYTEKLQKLSQEDRLVVYNMIDALIKKGE